MGRLEQAGLIIIGVQLHIAVCSSLELYLCCSDSDALSMLPHVTEPVRPINVYRGILLHTHGLG